ncbi:MAG: MFS transporter [Caulobacteraceae bacterium]
MRAEEGRVDIGVKAAYGFGSVAFGAAASGAGLLPLFLNQVLGIPPLIVGTMIMASLALDAVFDLIVGRWSDGVRTRWGRRHPFMYASAIPTAIFFFLLWNPPRAVTAWSLVVFMVVVMMATRLSVSLYEIASNALTPELTADFDERTSLQSWRWFFGLVGGAGASLLLNVVFLGGAHNRAGVLYREGYQHWSVVAAAIILVSILVSALGTHRRIVQSPVPVRRSGRAADQWREIRLTLMNRSLGALMLGGLVGGVAQGTTTALNVYLYTHVWDLTPRQFGWLAPMLAVGSVLAVAIVPRVGRRFGKKRAMIGLFLVSVAMSAGPLFLRLIGVMPPNGSPWILPILALDNIVTAALGVMGFILAGSMTADIVEDAAVRSGARSEGLLYAVRGLVAKFAGGIGAFNAGVLLTLVHFPAHAARGTVDPVIVRHLVLFYLPVTVALNLTAIAALGLYRIDRKTHERNLATLGEAAAVGMEAHIVEAVGAGEAASPTIRPM